MKEAFLESFEFTKGQRDKICKDLKENSSVTEVDVNEDMED